MILLDLFRTNVAYASLNDFLTKVNDSIINPLIGFLFALALVYFIYGMLEFILNSENEDKRTSGKSHMIWGIVGITIMLGVFSILNLITRSLNISSQVNPETGQVNLK